MLKQIDFTINNVEYCILYDSTKLTEEQAIIECEFVGWGMGHDESLFPYYIIVEKVKTPILKCIKEHILTKETNHDG